MEAKNFDRFKETIEREFMGQVDREPSHHRAARPA